MRKGWIVFIGLSTFLFVRKQPGVSGPLDRSGFQLSQTIRLHFAPRQITLETSVVDRLPGRIAQAVA